MKSLNIESTPCPKQAARNAEGYLQWHAKAEKHAKAGRKQTVCGVCLLWRWPDEQCEKFHPVTGIRE